MLKLSKKTSPFWTAGLRPAAAQEWPACGGSFPRLQAEGCFFRRTCRRKNRSNLFRAFGRELCEAFLKPPLFLEKSTVSFAIRFHFSAPSDSLLD